MKWPFGGPVRLRVPRQLGYKNIKYITRLTLTDNLRQFGKGRGSGVGGQNLDTRGTPASELTLTLEQVPYARAEPAGAHKLVAAPSKMVDYRAATVHDRRCWNRGMRPPAGSSRWAKQL
jgi:DMSO/TMAO reductase YedYZ molybdopterin-dependent catalytic subunit